MADKGTQRYCKAMSTEAPRTTSKTRATRTGNGGTPQRRRTRKDGSVEYTMVIQDADDRGRNPH